jgi:transcriptional regulator with XRE-family HTH domain
MEMNYQALANLRKQKNIKQSRMAELIGRDRTVYTKIENGKIKLNPVHIPVIAKELGVTDLELYQILYAPKSA